MFRAFDALILERTYDDITVEEVSGRAGVGRSTFYTHFKDKDALMHARIQRLADGIDRSGPVSRERFRFSLFLFRQVVTHADHIRSLTSHSLALATITEAVSDQVRGEMREMAGTRAIDSDRFEFTAQFVVGAFMSVLRWWLETGNAGEPERMDEMFQSLTQQALCRPPDAAEPCFWCLPAAVA